MESFNTNQDVVILFVKWQHIYFHFLLLIYMH